MTIPPNITVPDADVTALCKRYRIRELSVFGSAARGEMNADSDVDLLVEFKADARIGLLELSALQREFSLLLGHRVDIAVKPALKRLIRSEILADAHVLYAA